MTESLEKHMEEKVNCGVYKFNYRECGDLPKFVLKFQFQFCSLNFQMCTCTAVGSFKKEKIASNQFLCALIQVVRINQIHSDFNYNQSIMSVLPIPLLFLDLKSRNVFFFKFVVHLELSLACLCLSVISYIGRHLALDNFISFNALTIQRIHSVSSDISLMMQITAICIVLIDSLHTQMQTNTPMLSVWPSHIAVCACVCVCVWQFVVARKTILLYEREPTFHMPLAILARALSRWLRVSFLLRSVALT